ncbi:MAG: sirohydrochlorin chelatase [Beutenbergiaceae bacterium]
MRQPTLLACSHGTSSALGQAAVASLESAVKDRHEQVCSAFVDVQTPDVPTALARIDGPVRVVPLLLSAGYHVYVDLTEAVACRPEAILCAALGPDPRLVRVLRQRLDEAGLRDSDQVVLAAAGSSDARAVQDCRATARMLGQQLGRTVRVGFLSASQPRLSDVLTAARARGSRVVVASYLLAPGYFADLVGQAGADVVSAPLLRPSWPVPVELVDVVLARYHGRAPERHA